MMTQIRGRTARRGFTMVELLITITLAAGGIMSMVALTTLKTRMVTFERNIAVSQNIAQGIAAQLTAESLNWTPSAPLTATTTPLLFYGMNGMTSGPGGSIGQAWLAIPNRNGTNSPTFNPMGIPSEPVFGGDNLNPGNFLANVHYQRFCVHYRLAYQGMSQQIIEYEIRVFFPLRDDSFGPVHGFSNCGFHNPVGMSRWNELFNYYSLPGIVSQ